MIKLIKYIQNIIIFNKLYTYFKMLSGDQDYIMKKLYI